MRLTRLQGRLVELDQLATEISFHVRKVDSAYQGVGTGRGGGRVFSLRGMRREQV